LLINLNFRLFIIIRQIWADIGINRDEATLRPAHGLLESMLSPLLL